MQTVVVISRGRDCNACNVHAINTEANMPRLCFPDFCHAKKIQTAYIISDLTSLSEIIIKINMVAYKIKYGGLIFAADINLFRPEY